MFAFNYKNIITINYFMQILGGSSTQHQQKKKNEDDDLKDMSKIFKPVAKTSTQQNVSAGNLFKIETKILFLCKFRC